MRTLQDLLISVARDLRAQYQILCAELSTSKAVKMKIMQELLLSSSSGKQPEMRSLDLNIVF